MFIAKKNIYSNVSYAEYNLKIDKFTKYKWVASHGQCQTMNIHVKNFDRVYQVPTLLKHSH